MDHAHSGLETRTESFYDWVWETQFTELLNWDWWLWATPGSNMYFTHDNKGLPPFKWGPLLLLRNVVRASPWNETCFGADQQSQPLWSARQEIMGVAPNNQHHTPRSTPDDKYLGLNANHPRSHLLPTNRSILPQQLVDSNLGLYMLAIFMC